MSRARKTDTRQKEQATVADTYQVLRTGAYGNLCGAIRYLGSCDCGCGWQFASTHETVSIVERRTESGRLVDRLTWRASCALRLSTAHTEPLPPPPPVPREGRAVMSTWRPPSR